MADRPVPALGGRTPMEVAHTPAPDDLSESALIGTVLYVPDGMVPESNTTNLAILSTTRAYIPRHVPRRGVPHLTEEAAHTTRLYLPDGTALMGMLFART